MMQSFDVQYYKIEEDQAGQRLDNFLFARFRNLPKSRLYRALRTGEVRVNKKRVKAEYRLMAEDKIRIPPLKVHEKQEFVVHDKVCNTILNAIIYEDEQCIILNKPVGIPVHGGTEHSYGAIDALRKARPDIKFLELAHRLDKETSGCLLIAKKRSALRIYHELFRENKIKKEYLCLVKGVWEGGKRVVDAPLKKNILQSGERMVRIDPEGKTALTDFVPEKRFKSLSLLAVRLHTGRTHQIRVHLQHIHHPIIGDDKYGDKALNKQCKALGTNRMFLHAHKLYFTMPESGQVISVTAPLDDAFNHALDVAANGE